MVFVEVEKVNFLLDCCLWPSIDMRAGSGVGVVVGESSWLLRILLL